MHSLLWNPRDLRRGAKGLGDPSSNGPIGIFSDSILYDEPWPPIDTIINPAATNSPQYGFIRGIESKKIANIIWPEKKYDISFQVSMSLDDFSASRTAYFSSAGSGNYIHVQDFGRLSTFPQRYYIASTNRRPERVIGGGFQDVLDYYRELVSGGTDSGLTTYFNGIFHSTYIGTGLSSTTPAGGSITCEDSEGNESGSYTNAFNAAYESGGVVASREPATSFLFEIRGASFRPDNTCDILVRCFAQLGYPAADTAAYAFMQPVAPAVWNASLLSTVTVNFLGADFDMYLFGQPDVDAISFWATYDINLVESWDYDSLSVGP